MKVLAAREKLLPDGTVFRNVDILLSKGEARRLPLEDFGKKLEGNVGDVKIDANFENVLKDLFGIGEPNTKQAPQKARNRVCPLEGFSIQTIHVNEEKKLMTVVFSDGTHEIVKCSPEDCFDTEIGFALALTRKLFGSKTKVRKFISNNAKVLKAPAPQPKKGVESLEKPLKEQKANRRK